ncbi:hypothetical protein [Comamonas testosteroni]|uniref:Uncharacterized protein n=1 Tax=Comamonas testosteroni TaxID=285 RepID=A0A096FLP0_COMTE|nr:hypothetical protein [Comamonas testosteroni]KGH30829.1 hypothetical protein P353_08185 [Comamonas testosteroni]WKL18752.1 hypothetical protein QYQ99_27510 [Comamonas testosteroni]
MKHALLTIIGVLLTANASASSPDSVLIVCDKVSDANLGKLDLYKKPPKNEDEHILNIISGDGIASLLVEKPKRITLVLKESVNRIENTDGTTQFGGATIEFNSHHVKAVGKGQVLNINRVTGAMTHTFILSDETIASWKSKHGGTLPKAGTWRYQCQKSAPAF